MNFHRRVNSAVLDCKIEGSLNKASVLLGSAVITSPSPEFVSRTVTVPWSLAARATLSYLEGSSRCLGATTAGSCAFRDEAMLVVTRIRQIGTSLMGLDFPTAHAQMPGLRPYRRSGYDLDPVVFQTRRYFPLDFVFDCESDFSASSHHRSIFSRHAGSSAKNPLSNGAFRRIAAFHIDGTCCWYFPSR